MICSKCKKEVEETFTNDKWEQICKECLHNEIYKNRQKLRKYRWKHEGRISKIRNSKDNGRIVK